MERISAYFFLVFYLIIYQAYALFMPLEGRPQGKWMIENSNLGTTGEFTQSFQTESMGPRMLGKIFSVHKDPSGQIHTESRVVEVSHNGMSVDQGFLDPVQAVNRAMSKTGDSNILNTRAKQLSPQPSVFDPMQSVQLAMSQTMRNMDSMMNNRHTASEPRNFDQRHSIQHTFSQTSSNVDRRKTDKLFSHPDVASVANVGRTETSHGSSAISTFDNQFPNLRGGSFRSPMTSGPARRFQTQTVATPSPRASSAISTFHPQFPRTGTVQTTPTPLLKPKTVTEIRNESGTTGPKPMCIYIDDPVYNTLCLMKTEGFTKKNTLEGVTQIQRKKETGKETFKAAANLVSVIAKGMCAFCCHADLRSQEKCFKRFCENKTSC
ncbi:uncharacterized protein LOC134233348 isoform X2 [Saccostrea cucullata]|uniref:uncharacterized protein LOC134233348 isoform X2 n=1 Tax=Saccostrea cuccullata TaxID=36930 RepID=UPI002ED29B35